MSKPKSSQGDRSKPKSSQGDRTKRAPPDPSPERQKQLEQEREEAWRPADDLLNESDGTVGEEQEEFDTDKYEPAPKRHG
jgi:hypothetical protein